MLDQVDTSCKKPFGVWAQIICTIRFLLASLRKHKRFFAHPSKTTGNFQSLSLLNSYRAPIFLQRGPCVSPRQNPGENTGLVSLEGFSFMLHAKNEEWHVTNATAGVSDYLYESLI